MSCQPSGTKGRAREEAAVKCRRPKSKKVAAALAKSTQVKTQQIIDLTTEEEEQEDQNQENHVEVDLTKTMEIPAHLESDDYFEILSLSRSASVSDVKRAYRKLAVQWHPDKNRSNPRAEELFKKISEAYEVLSDPEKRNLYEKYDNKGPQRGAAHSPEHFEVHGRGGGFSTQHARDIFDAFFGGQDPFEAFFGGGRQRRGSRRFGVDPFESMGFGGMGMGMNMRGFRSMSGMSMMDSFISDGFGGMDGSRGGVFSTSTSSSSSTFTDQNGNVILQKTTTTTGPDGRTETVTEEYRNGKLVNSSSSSSRLTDAGRMQLEGSSTTQSKSKITYQRRRSSNSRPKY